jgi:PhnB protein
MAEALIERLDRTVDVILSRGDASAALADAELAPLARMANELRFCPSPAFKTRLRAQLERKKTMPMLLEDVKVREGFTTVTPYLQVTDSGLFDFLAAVFGAVETERTTTPRGVHREVRIGDSMLMIGEAESTGSAHSPGAFHIYVPDVDAAFERAIAAGATSLGEPADRPYGERAGFVQDAWANHWYIATHLGATHIQPGLRTITPFIHPRDVPAYIEFLKQAFSAVEEFRHEENGVIMHARIRVGNAAIEMGDTQGQAEPMPSGFYLYVADCDALYQQAVAAGATSIYPPTDMWYGDRSAAVKDSQGITWSIARPA